MNRREAILLLARAAVRSIETIPPSDRIQLLRALAMLLPQLESEQAEHAAYLLEKAENQQLKFIAILGNPDNAPS